MEKKSRPVAGPGDEYAWAMRLWKASRLGKAEFLAFAVALILEIQRQAMKK